MEYSAASDSYTACPEGFKEFYNQRRRWTPSTFLNSVDLLSTNYKRVIANNDDFSFFYIIYQFLAQIFGTIVGPGSIVLSLSGAFTALFPLNDNVAIIISLGLWIFFIMVCFTCKSDVQLSVAYFLTVIYSIVMVAMFVAMIIQMIQEPSTPTSIGIMLFLGIFPVAALLHPQELGCYPMFFIYFLTLPSMSLLLTTYSFFNLDNVSWGTRYALFRPLFIKNEILCKIKKMHFKNTCFWFLYQDEKIMDLDK